MGEVEWWSGSTALTALRTVLSEVEGLAGVEPATS